MSVIKLNECKICMGCGRIQKLYGKSLLPKCTYISCDCGLRTPLCDTQDEAVKIWNWMNRESYTETQKKEAKQAKLDAYAVQEKESKQKAKAIVKARVALTKDTIAIANEEKKEAKKKRHRRTKAEMEAARALESQINNQKPEAKKKRHRRTKAEMEAARALEAKNNARRGR